MNDEEVRAAIREILASDARLSRGIDELSDQDDLYNAGLTSFASVNVMLALENRFDVEFPDEMLTRTVFESIDNIASAIGNITAAA